MYPKARFDALTDGIFAVAMTLLVLDIHLPDDFHPQNDADLLRAFVNLFPRVWPYALSFFILGLRWRSTLGDREHNGPVSRSCAKWWLFYLLVVTFVPFTTVVMGRYPERAPAIWLYAGTALVLAGASLRIIQLMPETHSQEMLRERRVTNVGLAAASVLAIVWSFWDPAHAMVLFALVAVFTAADRWIQKRRPAEH